MLLVLIYSRGRNGEKLGMGTPSLVHPDFRPGVCSVPSDEGTFALVGSGFISAASSKVTASLGMDAFSRSPRETHRCNSSQDVQCPHRNRCS